MTPLRLLLRPGMKSLGIAVVTSRNDEAPRDGGAVGLKSRELESGAIAATAGPVAAPAPPWSAPSRDAVKRPCEGTPRGTCRDTSSTGRGRGGSVSAESSELVPLYPRLSGMPDSDLDYVDKQIAATIAEDRPATGRDRACTVARG